MKKCYTLVFALLFLTLHLQAQNKKNLLITKADTPWSNQGPRSSDILVAEASSCRNINTQDWTKVDSTFYNYTGGLSLSGQTNLLISGPGYVNFSRTLYTYNLSGNITLLQEQRWNATNLWWNDSEKIAMTYNSHNAIVTIDAKKVNQGVLLNNYKTIFNYDFQNNLKKITTSLFDETGEYFSTNAVRYSYQNSSLLSEEHQSSKDSGITWINLFKEEYTYDSITHKHLTTTTWVWNTSISMYLENSLQKHVYNAGNHTLISDTSFDWNISESAWEPVNVTNYTYYSNNLLKEEKHFSKNLSGTFYETNDILYTYTIDNEFESKESHSFNGLAWITVDSIFNVYDNANRTVTIFSRSKEPDWNKEYKLVKYFMQGPVGTEEPVAKLEASVFPNPGIGFYNVVLPGTNNELSAEVYNLLGETILNKRINASTFQLDLSSQPNGVYLLKVDNGKEINFHRLVKQ